MKVAILLITVLGLCWCASKEPQGTQRWRKGYAVPPVQQLTLGYPVQDHMATVFDDYTSLILPLMNEGKRTKLEKLDLYGDDAGIYKLKIKYTDGHDHYEKEYGTVPPTARAKVNKYQVYYNEFLSGVRGNVADYYGAKYISALSFHNNKRNDVIQIGNWKVGQEFRVMERSDYEIVALAGTFSQGRLAYFWFYYV